MKVPEPRKMSSGNYFIQLRLNGVSIPVTAPTAKECKNQAMLIKAEYMAGKKDVAPSDTLEAAVKSYIKSKVNVLSPATIRGYNIICNNRFRSVMGQPMRSIRDWQSVINREAALCSAKTLKNSWGLIASVLRANNITPPKVTLPQTVDNPAEWLTPEQITTFVAAVKDEPYAPAALLALHSLRRSEIFAVAQNNGVDIENGVIHVRGAVVPDSSNKFIYKKANKNKTSARDIPIMIPELTELLKNGAPLVECAPDTLRKRINRICKANGLPEVGIHGLRHSFASLAYHLGWSEQYTMEIGGWADAGTMRKIYTHLSQKDKLSKTNTMAQFFKNAN